MRLSQSLAAAQVIVDDQQERVAAYCCDVARRIGADGDATISSAAISQTQHHQPPRRAVGLFLARDELEQQARWAESGRWGLGGVKRRSHQMTGSSAKAGERPGRGEGQMG